MIKSLPKASSSLRLLEILTVNPAVS